MPLKLSVGFVCLGLLVPAIAQAGHRHKATSAAHPAKKVTTKSKVETKQASVVEPLHAEESPVAAEAPRRPLVARAAAPSAQ